MGWGGSAQAANDSLKYNRGQLKKRPKLFKKNWSYFNAKSNYLKASGGIESYKKLNDDQKRKIRKQYREKQTISKRRMFLFTVFCVLIFIISLLVFEHSIKIHEKVVKKEKIINKKVDMYLQYLQSGDNWIEDDKWDAAIILYQKALKLIPNDYDANYRIALAYSYKCERIKYDCDIGENLVNQLLIDYPDHKKQLNKLDTIFKRNLTAPVIIGN